MIDQVELGCFGQPSFNAGFDDELPRIDRRRVPRGGICHHNDGTTEVISHLFDLQDQGWTILRAWNAHLLRETALDDIAEPWARRPVFAAQSSELMTLPLLLGSALAIAWCWVLVSGEISSVS